MQLSCGEHCDYGLLTLVNQDPHVTALQVGCHGACRNRLTAGHIAVALSECFYRTRWCLHHVVLAQMAWLLFKQRSSFVIAC